VRSLAIPPDERERLLAMTPRSYVGQAAALARREAVAGAMAAVAAKLDR